MPLANYMLIRRFLCVVNSDCHAPSYHQIKYHWIVRNTLISLCFRKNSDHSNCFELMFQIYESIRVKELTDDTNELNLFGSLVLMFIDGFLKTVTYWP